MSESSSSDDDPLLASVDPGEPPDFTESMRLVVEAQGGDREALDQLLRRYEDRIKRIVRIRLGAKLRRCVESVDILQETWQAAFEHIGTLELRSTSSIMQWLSRIAENRILDIHRHFYGLKRNRKREVRLSDGGRMGDDGEEKGAVPIVKQKTPDEIVSQEEVKRIVDEAMAELPDEYREVILLRTYFGGSWDEVAKQTGRPNADATRQLHRRARIRLGRLVREKISGELL